MLCYVFLRRKRYIDIFAEIMYLIYEKEGAHINYE